SIVPRQSDLALNPVASFLVAVEKFAPQHCPVDVRTWATTRGDCWSGSGESPRSSFPALICTFALPVALAFSRTFVMPSGTPVLLLNFQPVGNAAQQGGVSHELLGCPWSVLIATPLASS